VHIPNTTYHIPYRYQIKGVLLPTYLPTYIHTYKKRKEKKRKEKIIPYDMIRYDTIFLLEGEGKGGEGKEKIYN